MLKRSPLACKQLPEDGKGRRHCRSRAEKRRGSYAVALGRSGYKTYLGIPKLVPRVAPDLGVSRCWVARLGPCEPPLLPCILLCALRPQVPALERAQPPLVCQVVMSCPTSDTTNFRAPCSFSLCQKPLLFHSQWNVNLFNNNFLSRGQGQGVRAGEPVRAPETRC